MIKNNFFQYKPSNVRAKICLPERIYLHTCPSLYVWEY